MDTSRKVIGKLYTDAGILRGNIVGLSGSQITVESLDESDTDPALFSIKAIQQVGWRIEWVNVRPVGEHYGEF